MEKKHWYDELLEKGKEENPDLPDRECSKCGEELVRGSINYSRGHHIDGCPFITAEH